MEANGQQLPETLLYKKSSGFGSVSSWPTRYRQEGISPRRPSRLNTDVDGEFTGRRDDRGLASCGTAFRPNEHMRLPAPNSEDDNFFSR